MKSNILLRRLRVPKKSRYLTEEPYMQNVRGYREEIYPHLKINKLLIKNKLFEKKKKKTVAVVAVVVVAAVKL